MTANSTKIDQILLMVQELSHSEKVGLVQRIVQMFLPTAESAPTRPEPSANGNIESAFYQHPQQSLMLEEEAAFDAMINDLQATYLEQYVALHQGEVLDSDKDIVALSTRISQSHPNQVVLIRQVCMQPEPELRWRSLRLIDNP